MKKPNLTEAQGGESLHLFLYTLCNAWIFNRKA